jgi:hypothetical protein
MKSKEKDGMRKRSNLNHVSIGFKTKRIRLLDMIRNASIWIIMGIAFLRIVSMIKRKPLLL